MSSRPGKAAQGKTFPITGSDESILWHVISPHEKQAILNHRQSLQDLSERDGLSWIEVLRILNDQPLYPFQPDIDARAKVLEIVAKADTPAPNPLPRLLP